MKMLQRFLLLLVIGGLPPAVLVTLAVHFNRSLHLVEGVATTLTSATIIALALTAVAHGYATYVRRRGATVGFFLVIMPIVGGFAAVSAYVDASRAPRPRWHALAAPPEPIADLTGPDCYSGMPLLYARAKTGKIYQISTMPGKAWRIASDVPRQPDRFGDCSPRDNTEMLRSSRAPGRVVDSHWMEIQGGFCGGHARHVLLDDGSIWQWSTYRCTGCVSSAAFLFPLVAVACSVAAALFIAFSSSSLGWPRRSPSAAA